MEPIPTSKELGPNLNKILASEGLGFGCQSARLLTKLGRCGVDEGSEDFCRVGLAAQVAVGRDRDVCQPGVKTLGIRISTIERSGRCRLSYALSALVRLAQIGKIKKSGDLSTSSTERYKVLIELRFHALHRSLSKNLPIPFL